MVARKALSRKALFAAALVEAGMSAPEFADKIGGVSNTQLHRTLLDAKSSAPLTAKIDAFIREHVGKGSRNRLGDMHEARAIRNLLHVGSSRSSD